MLGERDLTVHARVLSGIGGSTIIGGARSIGHTSAPVIALRSPLRATTLRVFLRFILRIVFRSVDHVNVIGRRHSPIPSTGYGRGWVCSDVATNIFLHVSGFVRAVVKSIGQVFNRRD